ncbi:hypothetical protein HanHA89_Chr05g0209271 [Helianthus annuus]|nr:hypothetical protein HanHA89_Chr05g0209271 [Helianthus annuus]
MLRVLLVCFLAVQDLSSSNFMCFKVLLVVLFSSILMWLEFCLFVCCCAGFIFINCYVLRVPHMCFVAVWVLPSSIVMCFKVLLVCFVVVSILFSSILIRLRFCLCVLLLLGFYLHQLCVLLLLWFYLHQFLWPKVLLMCFIVVRHE